MKTEVSIKAEIPILLGKVWRKGEVTYFNCFFKCEAVWEGTVTLPQSQRANQKKKKVSAQTDLAFDPYSPGDALQAVGPRLHVLTANWRNKRLRPSCRGKGRKVQGAGPSPAERRQRERCSGREGWGGHRVSPLPTELHACCLYLCGRSPADTLPPKILEDEASFTSSLIFILR